MLTVTSSLSILALLVVCLHSGAAGKNQCPDTSLGNVVAQQNGKLMELMGQLQTSQVQVKDLEMVVQSSQQTVQELEQKLQATQAEMEEKLQAAVEQLKSDISKKRGGAVYIRWGRKTCPEQISTLVYEGLAGGKFYNQPGSGTNHLCLTTDPVYDSEAMPKYFGHVYGAEYEHIPDVHNDEVPCALCRTAHSTVFMLPGTVTCPEGYTTQYTGHLTSSYFGHYASEYVCLDNDKVVTQDSTDADNNGLLFYFVVGVCGSLPCGPYNADEVLTCVVCSK